MSLSRARSLSLRCTPLIAKVSALFGFLLLTALFEFPILVAITFRAGALPMEWALNLVQLFFLIGVHRCSISRFFFFNGAAEGLWGYSATSLLTNDQTTQNSHVGFVPLLALVISSCNIKAPRNPTSTAS